MTLNGRDWNTASKVSSISCVQKTLSNAVSGVLLSKNHQRYLMDNTETLSL